MTSQARTRVAIRAGRELLRASFAELARWTTGVSAHKIAQFEAGRVDLRPHKLDILVYGLRSMALARAKELLKLSRGRRLDVLEIKRVRVAEDASRAESELKAESKSVEIEAGITA
jgi:predicted transcriptional regulator